MPAPSVVATAVPKTKGPANAAATMSQYATNGVIVRLEAAAASRLPPSLKPATTLNASAHAIIATMSHSFVAGRPFF